MDEEQHRTGGGVWHELYSFVYRYARRRGIPHTDAEDLAQAVLETACLHLDAVAPGKLQAWLTAVARNKIADRARRGGASDIVAELPDAIDAAPGPAEIVLQSIDRENLLASIAQLPDRDRQLVTMRYLEERTLEDVASELSMTTNAAKVALFRARGRLRGILEQTGDTDA